MLLVLNNKNESTQDILSIQCSPLMMLGMYCVISELCDNGIILQRNYWKMTIYGHFPITFGKITWSKF